MQRRDPADNTKEPKFTLLGSPLVVIIYIETGRKKSTTPEGAAWTVQYTVVELTTTVSTTLTLHPVQQRRCLQQAWGEPLA